MVKECLSSFRWSGQVVISWGDVEGYVWWYVIKYYILLLGEHDHWILYIGRTWWHRQAVLLPYIAFAGNVYKYGKRVSIKF